ncbi:MAG: hypothetical protein P8173_07290 [Gammaproteobacteria bacterium]
MNPVKLLTLPYRYKPWHPRHLRLIVADLFGQARQTEHDHMTHLRAAIEWLCRAQDVRDDHADSGGVSAGWSFEDGWLPSYPETSGYIVETFIAASNHLDDLDLRRRANRIIDWELSIQHPDGAFPGHFGEPGSRPVIFNTGQIMHGLLAGYTQLAWALLAVGLMSGESEFKRAAIRNLDWALSQQKVSGWFATNTFTPDRTPFTHTIAYAIRGFLESGVLLGDDRYVRAASKAAIALADVQRHDGWLAGTYDDNWVPRASYCCLTGMAQMSLNWIRLAQTCKSLDLKEAVRCTIGYLKRNHRINDHDLAVKGGIAGSAPIWGRYSMFEYPNWAAKFFADALIMDMTDTAIPPVLELANDAISG